MSAPEQHIPGNWSVSPLGQWDAPEFNLQGETAYLRLRGIDELYAVQRAIHDALQDQRLTVSGLILTLRSHWLAGVDCDEARGQDRARCACSRPNLGWKNTVGSAVDSWIQHVLYEYRHPSVGEVPA